MFCENWRKTFPMPSLPSETLISLLEEHHRQRKKWAKRSKRKIVEAGVIANRKSLDSADTTDEKEMEDDRTI